MTSRKKCTVVIPPSPDERGNPIAWRIFAQRDWRENQMPQLAKRHPDAHRNEVFLMNVTAQEFTYLRTKFPIGDFKKVRLGQQAFTTSGKLLPVGHYMPMFGALKKGPRLRRKEAKKTKRKNAKTKN